MSAFLSPLRFQDDGGLPFTLLEPLRYRSPLFPDGDLVVPATFRTDLASIPRLLWNVLPPVGKYDAAAVLHDFLYQYGDVSRFHADCVLKEAMAVLGCSSWQQFVIFTGVRAGGFRVWAKYRAAEKVQAAA